LRLRAACAKNLRLVTDAVTKIRVALATKGDGSKRGPRKMASLTASRLNSAYELPMRRREPGLEETGTAMASLPNTRNDPMNTFILRTAPIASFCATTFVLTSAACGAAGTRPHDMSAPQHEAAAAQEEQSAGEHAAQHDPNATATEQRCTGGKGRVCWTQTVNPTQGHEDSADEHRELAARHRAASQALRAAEASACTGISDEDRDTSPFAHREDIRSVSKLSTVDTVGKNRTTRGTGATIVFRATPGLTVEWLQRIVDCHLARNAAAGHDMPEMAYCPLVPRGAKASVRSVGDGFAVDVSSEDAESAAEIWRRAQRLGPVQ
jgi:hypothetical protein